MLRPTACAVVMIASLTFASDGAALPPLASGTSPEGALATQAGAKPLAAAALPSAAGDKAQAQKAASERAAQLAEARRKLASDEPAQMLEGIDALKELGGADAAEPIIARLKRGLPPQLTEGACDALLVLKAQGASPVLLELALHRRWQVRQKAIQALSALNVKSAEAALLYALEDPSPEVRSAAALALSVVGDARAMPALVRSFERGVDGAATALGKLARGKDVERLIDRAKSSPLELPRYEPALRELLARTDVQVAQKVKLLSTLRGLEGPAAQETYARLLELARTQNDARLTSALDGLEGRVTVRASVASATAVVAPTGGK